MWKPQDGRALDDLGRAMASGEAELPPITAEDITQALGAMPGTKATGLDAWALAELKRLSPEAKRSLAIILNRAEEEGGLPAGLSGAKLVFIPKSKGKMVMSQRPIGILPMLYRLWARIRLRHTELAGLVKSEPLRLWGCQGQVGFGRVLGFGAGGGDRGPEGRLRPSHRPAGS